VNSGEEAAISLERFSYLPNFITSRTLFPVIVQQGAARLPGMLVPEGMGASAAAEVIVPIYSPAGKLIELRKPVELRMSAGPGCQLLKNPHPATATRASGWVFFCGDHFKRLPYRLR
jgi:hypothetical protein